MIPSNQGRDIDQCLDDVDGHTLTEAAKVAWIEMERHPSGATCRCPAIEVVGVLYEQGYRLTREPK